MKYSYMITVLKYTFPVSVLITSLHLQDKYHVNQSNEITVNMSCVSFLILFIRVTKGP